MLNRRFSLSLTADLSQHLVFLDSDALEAPHEGLQPRPQSTGRPAFDIFDVVKHGLDERAEHLPVVVPIPQCEETVGGTQRLLKRTDIHRNGAVVLPHLPVFIRVLCGFLVRVRGQDGANIK